jgi:hypothetical protein
VVLRRLRAIADTDHSKSGIAPIVGVFANVATVACSSKDLNRLWLELVASHFAKDRRVSAVACRVGALRRIDERLLELVPRSDSKKEKKARRNARRAEVAARSAVPTQLSSPDDDEADDDEHDDEVDEVGAGIERLELNLTPAWHELGRAAGRERPRSTHQRECVDSGLVPPPASVEPMTPRTPPLPTTPELPPPNSTRPPSPEPISTPPPTTPPPAAPAPASSTPPSMHQHDLECGLCLDEGVGRAVLSCACSKACFKCITEALAASTTSTCPFCLRNNVFVLIDHVYL